MRSADRDGVRMVHKLLYDGTCTIQRKRRGFAELVKALPCTRGDMIKPLDDAGLSALLGGPVEPVAPAAAAPNRYPDAIAIKTGARYVVTRVAEIDWIEADGNYVKVHIQKRPRVLNRSLASLERELLDPEMFVRVHRSAIVNAAKISAVEPQFYGELTIVLLDGSRVPCSRRYRKRLEARLFFTS